MSRTRTRSACALGPWCLCTYISADRGCERMTREKRIADQASQAASQTRGRRWTASRHTTCVSAGGRRVQTLKRYPCKHQWYGWCSTHQHPHKCRFRKRDARTAASCCSDIPRTVARNLMFGCAEQRAASASSRALPTPSPARPSGALTPRQVPMRISSGSFSSWQRGRRRRFITSADDGGASGVKSASRAAVCAAERTLSAPLTPPHGLYSKSWGVETEMYSGRSDATHRRSRRPMPRKVGGSPAKPHAEKTRSPAARPSIDKPQVGGELVVRGLVGAGDERAVVETTQRRRGRLLQGGERRCRAGTRRGGCYRGGVGRGCMEGRGRKGTLTVALQ